MMNETVDIVKDVFIWGTIPIIASLYFLHRILFRSNWRSIHFISEFSPIILLIASAILCKILWNLSVIGYFFIVLFIGLSFILVYQRKHGTEVSLLKAMKIVMRISFLFFTVIYFGLFITYIIQYTL